MRDLKKWAIIDSLGTTAYIILIVSFIYFLGQIQAESGESILVSIAMLMLFVFSAAFTGSLVFGRPILWYLDGRKKDAFYLLAYTLGILLALTILVFIFLLIR